VLLDGWSDDESFADGDRRRTFVWMEGSESALRVGLPAGSARLGLRASPMPDAVGVMTICLGRDAWATVNLRPGWQTYQAAVVGRVAGGPTTVVFKPSAYHRPRPFESEHRPLSVAVDGVAFDDGPLDANRGGWPVGLAAGRCGFMVSGEAILTSAPARVALQLVTVSAQLVWTDGSGTERTLWRDDGQCGAPGACRAECVTPNQAGQLRLRSERAVVSGLSIEPLAAPLRGRVESRP
jgi:hypothetical protein